MKIISPLTKTVHALLAKVYRESYKEEAEIIAGCVTTATDILSNNYSVNVELSEGVLNLSERDFYRYCAEHLYKQKQEFLHQCNVKFYEELERMRDERQTKFTLTLTMTGLVENRPLKI